MTPLMVKKSVEGIASSVLQIGDIIYGVPDENSLPCDGRLLEINSDNQALFEKIRTKYGCSYKTFTATSGNDLDYILFDDNYYRMTTIGIDVLNESAGSFTRKYTFNREIRTGYLAICNNSLFAITIDATTTELTLKGYRITSPDNYSSFVMTNIFTRSGNYSSNLSTNIYYHYEDDAFSYFVINIDPQQTNSQRLTRISINTTSLTASITNVQSGVHAIQEPRFIGKYAYYMVYPSSGSSADHRRCNLVTGNDTTFSFSLQNGNEFHDRENGRLFVMPINANSFISASSDGNFVYSQFALNVYVYMLDENDNIIEKRFVWECPSIAYKYTGSMSYQASYIFDGKLYVTWKMTGGTHSNSPSNRRAIACVSDIIHESNQTYDLGKFSEETDLFSEYLGCANGSMSINVPKSFPYSYTRKITAFRLPTIGGAKIKIR